MEFVLVRRGEIRRAVMMREGPSSNPLISVIIPSYNSLNENERIDRLLSSIMKQTYKNFEIIVVDNFSTDCVRKVCKHFGVRFFELKSTISEARNFGLEKARGDFVIFLDCDQVLPPKLFEECVSLVNREDADCVILEIDCVPTETKNRKYFVNCADMHNLEVRAGIGTTGTKLPLFHSASVIGSERFPRKVQLGEDFIFASRIMKKKPKVKKAESRILHCEDPSIKGLAIRSFRYGRAYIGLQKYSRGAYTFLRNISVLDCSTMRRLLSILSSRPKTIFPFASYLLIKYVAFSLGYLSAKLSFR